jgi:hypothetical protein
VAFLEFLSAAAVAGIISPELRRGSPKRFGGRRIVLTIWTVDMGFVFGRLRHRE